MGAGAMNEWEWRGQRKRDRVEEGGGVSNARMEGRWVEERTWWGVGALLR